MMAADIDEPVQRGFLEKMAETSQARAAIAEAACGMAEMRQRAEQSTAPSPLILSDAGFDLIAEVKRRSPSEGTLTGPSVLSVDQARAYVSGGATALSVLTEPSEFNGSLAELQSVVAAVAPAPVMRKDFLVSPYQVLEARACGAAGVLLIAAILDRSLMQNMLDCALDLGMFVLLEVFDRVHLDHCMPVLESVEPVFDGDHCRVLLGVNSRDLSSLKVNFKNFAEIAPQLPTTMPWVAESGITEAAQVRALSGLGYRLALVGTSLMRSTNPAAAVRALCTAGR
jgi:indole-3-glycerol phosphate synthase